MATSVRFATYMIFFHDRNEYEFAVAAAGGTPETGATFDFSPRTAANFFGILYPNPETNMDLIDKGIVFNSVYNAHYQANPFPPPNIFLEDDNDDGVLIPSYDSSFGQAGQPYILKWSGVLVYMAGAQPSTPIPTPIPQRRWAIGFELIHGMEGAVGNSNAVGSREASRTIDGLGYPVRGTNGNNLLCDMRLSTFGITTRKSWERFYIRPRVNPSTARVSFWRCRNSVSPAAGAALCITSAGELEAVGVSAISTITPYETGPVLDLFKWYRIDVLLEYPATALDSGTLMVFVNGVLTFNITDSSGGSMDTTGNHAESNLGKGSGISALGTTDPDVEFDLDDWINAAWPENLGVLTLDSMDWLMGSHVRKVWASGASITGYTPNTPQIVNQGAMPEAAANAELASTTPGALIQATLDLPQLGVQDKFGEVAVGCVALTVGIWSRNNLNTSGQLGYNIAGAGNVMSAINEFSIGSYNAKLYNPSGLIQPAEINPALIRYTKSADAASVAVRALQATAEYIGVWGVEDVPDPELFPDDRPRTEWLHNCQYPNTPYGFMGPTIDTLVFAVGGTYVGNGTQQDITLPDACHMLFIRALTGGTRGVKWFACGLAGHLGVTERVVPNYPVRVYFDAVAGTFKFTVVGSNAEINASGVTYQYIAFCDPGMRFCVAGAYTAINNQQRTHALQNPDFTPELAFGQKDTLSAGSNVVGLWWKGPGNTGNAGNRFDSPATTVDFGAFAAGSFTNGTDLTDTGLGQFNYIMFRSVEPNCGWVMLQIMSYVGNGVSPRTIDLTPASGRFPMFVLICPTSGSTLATFRDPSHTGTSSARFSNLADVPVNGIQGSPAPDQITVGSDLNANGVTYNVFCIPGDLATAFLNGSYFPPSCDNPSPWYNPPKAPPKIAVMSEGGLTLDGTVPLTLLKDVSGIYTLVPGKTNDTLYDRQTGIASVDVKIPNPTAKTGFIGG